MPYDKKPAKKKADPKKAMTDRGKLKGIGLAMKKAPKKGKK